MTAPAPLRVAMFFDYRQAHTPGHYLRKILEETGPVDVFHPRQAEDCPSGGHDLYLRVDDSTHFLFPSRLKPSALWIMDTHLTYRADRIMARTFDFLFANNKSAAERFRKDGFPTTWLPVAFDPETHGRLDRPKVYPVAFIGGDGWGRRRRLLEKLRDRYPDAFISTAPHTKIGLIYSQAKIVFNCGIGDDLNMRVFEALGSGSCLVTNADTDGLSDLFTDGRHLAVYSGEDEAFDVIERLLNDDAKREAIAKAGMEEALAKHTYRRRLEAILSAARAAPPPRGRPLPPALAKLSIKALDFWYKVETNTRMALD